MKIHWCKKDLAYIDRKKSLCLFRGGNLFILSTVDKLCIYWSTKLVVETEAFWLIKGSFKLIGLFWSIIDDLLFLILCSCWTHNIMSVCNEIAIYFRWPQSQTALADLGTGHGVVTGKPSRKQWALLPLHVNCFCIVVKHVLFSCILAFFDNSITFIKISPSSNDCNCFTYFKICEKTYCVIPKPFPLYMKWVARQTKLKSTIFSLGRLKNWSSFVVRTVWYKKDVSHKKKIIE